MKKILAVLFLFLAVFSSLCACVKPGEVTLYVEHNGTVFEYRVDTEGKNIKCLRELMDYFDLNDKFSYTESGGMITAVNGYEPNSNAHEFWAIYTDITVDGIPYFDEAYGTADCNGKKLSSALKGMNELPISGGAVYLLKISVW